MNGKGQEFYYNGVLKYFGNFKSGKYNGIGELYN